MRSKKVKTGYGNGSVYEEKRGSGRWIAELGGVRRWARSEAEALEKLALLQQRREDRLKPESMTLEKWLDKWLTEHCGHLKERTRQSYEDIVRAYIRPFKIAKIRLEDLHIEDLNDWINSLRRRKLSSLTVASAHMRLKAGLKAAKRFRYISHNPAEDITVSRIPQRKPIILEPEEVLKLLDYLEGQRLYALFATELTTGLREAELIGLRWSDINLDEPSIEVEGQLHWLRQDGRELKPHWIDSAKTKAGQRKIFISHELANILKYWRETWEEEKLLFQEDWGSDDYVFTNQNGRPLRPHSLRSALRTALRAAGLNEAMTFHDLRHSAGSLMLAEGEDIRAVSELLGHSSVTVTETIYAHALKKSKARAGQSLGHLLKKRG